MEKNFVVLTVLAALTVSVPGYAQWEGWRGPEQNGVSRDTELPSSWSLDSESLLWRTPVGGRSTPVVHDGRVYIITRGGEGPTEHERVVAFEGETGQVLWQHRLNVFHTTIPGPRVGWASPCVDPQTGHVYVHGVQGLFVCYDRDGKILWSRSLTEEQGRISGYGGRTNTPVVDGDLVILSFLNSSWGKQARGTHRFFAFDKRNGDIVWISSPGGKPLDTTYSTPVVTVVDGVRLLIAGCADGAVYALKVRTGEKVWGFKLSKRGINVSPVAGGNLVYISHSEENLDSSEMGRVVCIDATGSGDITETGEVWRIDGLVAGYASPVLHEKTLYVIDNSANLYAINAGDGKKLWEYSLGTVGKGSAVWADGKLYAGEVNGRFHILKPGAKECRSLSQVELEGPDGSPSEIFGSPAVASGRIYFTTRDETICIGNKSWKATSGPIPSLREESPRDPTDTPAFLLVTPGEVLLRPGDQVSFRARLFNDKGNHIGDAENAAWALKGLQGTLDGRGGFSVPVASKFQAGELAVNVGDLHGSARVRVVPGLPVEEDFESTKPGELPTGWIGLSPVKFKVVDLEGNRVLVKHGTSPRFTRAKAFLGASSAKDYTIQADLRGTFRRRSLPDMGIIGQRYNLFLMGNKRPKILRLNTWVPQPRLQKDVPFEWKEDIWYRMKLRVDVRGEKAMVRGKVWQRDTPEPKEWTVEVEDPLPHLEGSPGIYAYSAGTSVRSAGTDVYFDEIKVYPSKKVE